MNVVLTVLLTAAPDDAKSGVYMAADLEPFRTWAESLERGADVHGVILHDCDVAGTLPGVELVRVEPTPDVTPYFRRWQVAADYLAGHPEIVWTWCTDGTDVEMLHDPFPHMVPGAIYCGSEDEQVDFWWMRDHHRAPASIGWMAEHAGERPLLNAGLLGGQRFVVEYIARELGSMWSPDDLTDMAAFNRLLWGAPAVVTGPVVHSKLRAWDATADSWFRHK